jgi:hypothetical protein
MDTVLRLTNVNKSFGEHHVLHDVSFEAGRGELIGYIGPNGSGKSTTVKLMLGILGNYSGTIEVFGKNIEEDLVSYKRKIGYVPEILSLYESLTGEEYISFLSSVYELSNWRDRMQELAEIFNINDALTTRISGYSKGMKQKIAIIGSLIHNPDILFLDEPLNGMDTNSVAVFKEVLKTLTKQGKTIFYSSHIMEVVEQMSSRVILLKDGAVIADSTVEELKNNSNGSSMEDIFNNLTGFTSGHDLAAKFVDTLTGGETIENEK